MKKAVPETVFFASWLTAGSAIDRIFDDWRACVIFVFAFIFLIAAAMVLAGGEEEKDGMALRTFDRRMADPDKLTLGEFRQIVVATCMPDETALKMVKEVHRRTK